MSIVLKNTPVDKMAAFVRRVTVGARTIDMSKM